MKKDVSTIIGILAVVVLVLVFGMEYYSYSKEQKAFDLEVEEKLNNLNVIETKIETEQAKAIEVSKKTSAFIPVPKKVEKYEPFIGMTDYEAIESTWGKPKSINKTETTYGVKEQWVYDSGYLYFEDHYLTSIQSSR